MKTKGLPMAVLTVLLLAATLSPVRGDSRGPRRHPAGRVTIDGKSFHPADTDQDDFSAVRREFRKFGVEVPPDSGSPGRNHPVFTGRLVGSEDPDPGNLPPLPQGLTADHSLRLESGSGAVDLVLGRMRTRGPSIGDRLVADGWEGPARGDSGGTPRFLGKKAGKETVIVFLDEAEGAFLLIRDGGR